MALAEIKPANIDHYEARVQLAAAFRWAVRLNLHEAVANHFSLAVSRDGCQFLINPNQRHFARIKASDLLLLDSNHPPAADDADAPDPTALGVAWGDAPPLSACALCAALCIPFMPRCWHRSKIVGCCP